MTIIYYNTSTIIIFIFEYATLIYGINIKVTIVVPTTNKIHASTESHIEIAPKCERDS